MSYDRETRKKRLELSKKKKRSRVDPGRRSFKKLKAELEEKNNRPVRDTEVLRRYFDELEEEDTDLSEVREQEIPSKRSKGSKGR